MQRWMSFRQRRMHVLLATCGLLIGVSQGILSPGAGASGGTDHGNTVTVVVTNRSVSPGHSSGTESAVGPRNVYVCTYTWAPPSMTAGLMTGGPEAGQFYIVTCTGPGLASHDSIIVWLANQVYGSSEGITPSAVAQRAASSIVLPSPVIRTDPAAASVVNIQTWLWIDPSVWHPRKATASLAGISATATATPLSVDFSMGDGSHLVCGGHGTPYNTSVPTGLQHTSCSHVYTRSSAGRSSPDGNPNDSAYAITATITWSVTWTANGFSGGGVLPSLTTSATTSLRVEQIESLQNS
jgi:hypothetical protein